MVKLVEEQRSQQFVYKEENSIEVAIPCWLSHVLGELNHCPVITYKILSNDYSISIVQYVFTLATVD